MNRHPSSEKWLVVLDDCGQPLAEFNFNSSRIRTYVFTVILPALMRLRYSFTITYISEPFKVLPYHYGFANDVFDSIHVTKEFLRNGIMRSCKGLVYIEKEYVL